MQACPLSLLTSRIRAYCKGKVRLILLQGHSFNCLPGPADLFLPGPGETLFLARSGEPLSSPARQRPFERQTISGSQKDAGAASSRNFLQQAAAGTAVRTGIVPGICCKSCGAVLWCTSAQILWCCPRCGPWQSGGPFRSFTVWPGGVCRSCGLNREMQTLQNLALRYKKQYAVSGDRVRSFGSAGQRKFSVALLEQDSRSAGAVRAFKRSSGWLQP